MRTVNTINRKPSLMISTRYRASILALSTVLATLCQAAPSAADKTFVGNVSQGGLYEVMASQLAVKRAQAPDVKDLAATEVHDHEQVNQHLKMHAAAAGIPVSGELNAVFQQRLAALTAVSAADFDSSYIDDMKQIHDKDEKLFAQEAIEGSPEFKSFAHETDLIVKRHIGALHGTD